MIFQFITNACGIITGNSGTKLITDPWLNNGVMEGSWCNYPPIVSRTSDFHDVDLIYLSPFTLIIMIVDFLTFLNLHQY